jgi:hypothetical protein
MPKIKLLSFLAAVICAFTGCIQNNGNHEQSEDKNDILWKATLTYCMSKEKPDIPNLEMGTENENCDIYYFHVSNQTGSLRAVLTKLYDTTISFKFPVYQVNIFDNNSPGDSLSKKEISNFISTSDTITQESINDSFPGGSKKETKVIKNDYTVNSVKGITFNHELIYDARQNKLSSAITDASLLIQVPDKPELLLTEAGFKFHDRTKDTVGLEQSALKQDVGWARDILLPVLYDSSKGLLLRVYARNIKLMNEPILKYTFNDTATQAYYGFPTQIKTVFNKKLVEYIWNAACSGLLQAYAYTGKGEIGKALSLKEVRDAGAIVDTITNDAGKSHVETYQIQSYTLSGLEIMEDIAFHKDNCKFDSKISYVAVLAMENKNGEYLPYKSKALFWVKMN